MSDTDDTDVLLLIPPDFFLVHSDSEDSYYDKPHDHCDPHCGVVDTLISQVSKLENRLNQIEINSELSHYNSLNSSCNSTIIPSSEMSGPRHYRGSDFRYNEPHFVSSSAKSTPQKPRTKLTVASLPSTPSTEKPSHYRYRKQQTNLSNVHRVNPSAVSSNTLASGTQDQSLDADISSFSTTPEKRNNKKILGEIDDFLSSVKTIKLVTAQKHLTPSFNTDETKNPEPQIRLDNPTITLNDLKSGIEATSKRFNRLNLKDVDRLLQAMESQQQMMDSKDKNVKSIYQNEHFNSKDTWACGESQETVPDLGYGMRGIMYAKDNHPHAQEEVVAKSVAHESETANPEVLNSKSESVSTSDSTPHTVLERNPNLESLKAHVTSYIQSQKVNDSHRSIRKYSENEFDASKSNFGPKNPLFNEIKVPIELNNTNLNQFNPSQTSSMSSINLFSLADIWNTNGKSDSVIISDKEMKKLLPKLEEEKCRRKHCEKLIQELQMKILEMQQRLAVAVQVDSAKDEAILRFHEAWEKVAHRWKSLETERNSLSQKLYSIEEKSSVDLAEAAQKVVHFEVEMSKALDLAHSSQEKCNSLEAERSSLLSQLTELQNNLKSSQANLSEIARQKEQLAEKISILEKDSHKDKKIILETQNEIAQSKSVFLTCQNELTNLKEEHRKLQKIIKDEQLTITQLETQKTNLESSLETVKKNESALQQEIKKIREETERSKLELRNFYQQQVEILVKDKLKEFQDQLEQAEKSLQDELHTREQTIARSAAKQLQKLTEKHRQEVQLIEEKHKEEVRLYELQFTQMKQQIHLLQSKLESYQARRTNIAQELHSVMEAQWLEALRIINNGKTPLAGSPQPAPEVAAGSGDGKEINFPNMRNASAVNDAAKTNAIPVETRQEKKIDESGISKFSSMNAMTDKIPFRINNDVFHNVGLYDTPVSSRQQNCSQQNDSELQKYIKMLLDKLPKTRAEKHLEDNRKMPEVSQDSSTSDFTDLSNWQQLGVSKGSGSLPGRDRSGKPPWK